MPNTLIKKIAAIGACTLFVSSAHAQESLDEFADFQAAAAGSDLVDQDSIAEFYKRSFAFWIKNAADYNADPGKYDDVIATYHRNQDKYVRDRKISLDRFEDTIERYRRFDNRNTLPKNPVLFVGSSSIVFWETASAFPDFPVINRGFGGASLPEVLHYYDDVVKKHAPAVVVVYCDIDVENGKSPEYSVNAFKTLVERVHADFPATQIMFLAMKPTLIDDVLGKDVRRNKEITNHMLAEYSVTQDYLHFVDISSVMYAARPRLKAEIFLPDGMHLNSLGYDLWNPIVGQKIKQLLRRSD